MGKHKCWLCVWKTDGKIAFDRLSFRDTHNRKMGFCSFCLWLSFLLFGIDCITGNQYDKLALCFVIQRDRPIIQCVRENDAELERVGQGERGGEGMSMRLLYILVHFLLPEMDHH